MARKKGYVKMTPNIYHVSTEKKEQASEKQKEG